MNCIIVDDDEIVRCTLESYITKTAGLTLLKSFEDPLQALIFVKEQAPDLIFLDMHMPELNGMDFIKYFEKLPQVIIVTSDPSFAAQAFDYSVTDFVVKPVTLTRFTQAVNKAIQLAEAFAPNNETTSQDVFVKTSIGLVKLPLADVVYLEAMADYVLFHMEDGKKHVVNSTLKVMEKKLEGQGIIRIHRSFLANMAQVSKVLDLEIHFNNGARAPLSSSNKAAFLSRIKVL